MSRRVGPGWTLRGIALLAVLSALIVPACEREVDDVAVALLLDLSLSVAEETTLDALQLAQRLADAGVELILTPFADRALVQSSIQEIRNLELIDSSSTTLRAGRWAPALDRAETNLEAAIDAARASLDHAWVGNVIAITDGAETRGDARAAAYQLVAEDLRLHTIPAQTAMQPPTIVGLEISGNTISGLGTAARVEIVASAGGTVELESRLGDGPRQTHPVELEPGRNDFQLPLTFAQAGSTLLSLRLPVSNSRWLETVEVQPPRRILAVDGSSPTSPLWRALERRGWRVDRLPARQLPQRAADYGVWQALILSDVPGNALSQRQQTAIHDWVLGGGNLLFAAGPNTYGEEGWAQGAVEEILPLHFRLEEEEPKVALMIALDKSYSMKGDKITLAREATKAALEELQDQQLFGLVAFDWNTFEVVPLQEAKARDEIKRRIDRIEPSAQTNFYPALESCLRQLSETEGDVVVRHVILISDGKTYPDDYQGLLARMRAAEITVSTVAVGEEADRELLAQIAEWGAGQSYFVRDASKVQRILLDEARQKSDRTLVEESLFAMVREPSLALRGIDFASAPPLRGYQTMEPTDEARILLEIGEEKPLLAARQSGLGSAWVFAADLAPRWSAEWIGWSSWAQLWSQLLADATTSEFAAPEQLEVTRRGSLFELVAELRSPDGAFVDAADARVELSGAADPQTIVLRQDAPGRYHGTVELDPSAGADFRFQLVVDGRPSARRTLYYPQVDERTPGVARTAFLQELASLTGGSFNPTFEELISPDERRARRRVALWPWFVALALGCVLVELALHRLGRD